MAGKFQEEFNRKFSEGCKTNIEGEEVITFFAL